MGATIIVSRKPTKKAISTGEWVKCQNCPTIFFRAEWEQDIVLCSVACAKEAGVLNEAKIQ